MQPYVKAMYRSFVNKEPDCDDYTLVRWFFKKYMGDGKFWCLHNNIKYHMNPNSDKRKYKTMIKTICSKCGLRDIKIYEPFN